MQVLTVNSKENNCRYVKLKQNESHIARRGGNLAEKINLEVESKDTNDGGRQKD